ncbi:basic salivary proline-rich protein 2-like [Monodelphis domestica]|uniref:basic salivary proline-rich protein 2-like n=1 Tax=Monodelphis domestica TaxID=13616 RepID=UPI0024E23FE4|nr:basic salivary proline-rich protein 2-like [Monodelphis domestica]
MTAVPGKPTFPSPPPLSITWLRSLKSPRREAGRSPLAELPARAQGPFLLAKNANPGAWRQPGREEGLPVRGRKTRSRLTLLEGRRSQLKSGQAQAAATAHRPFLRNEELKGRGPWGARWEECREPPPGHEEDAGKSSGESGKTVRTDAQRREEKQEKSLVRKPKPEPREERGRGASQGPALGLLNPGSALTPPSPVSGDSDSGCIPGPDRIPPHSPGWPPPTKGGAQPPRGGLRPSGLEALRPRPSARREGPGALQGSWRPAGPLSSGGAR